MERSDWRWASEASVYTRRFFIWISLVIMEFSKCLIGRWWHSWIYDEICCTSPIKLKIHRIMMRRVRREYLEMMWLLLLAFVSHSSEGKNAGVGWMGMNRWMMDDVRKASRKDRCPCSYNAVLSTSLYDLKSLKLNGFCSFFFWSVSEFHGKGTEQSVVPSCNIVSRETVKHQCVFL